MTTIKVLFPTQPTLLGLAPLSDPLAFGMSKRNKAFVGGWVGKKNLKGMMGGD
jgi:hypothetical protein